MQWEVASAKHIGGRGDQQDHVGVNLSPDTGYGLLALADGMGGHRGGALASRLLVETAQATWEQQTPGAWDARQLLAGLCREANTRIEEQGRRLGLDPHTTCVLVLLDQSHATWLHVGDSRLYLVRGGAVVSRTRDHSVVQLLVDMKDVSEEDMGSHPDQNKLLRSLGSGSDPEPDYGSSAIRDGDGIVLCSDGLWETIHPKEMAKALSASDLQSEADRLVDLAAERGGAGGDNVSLILARATGGAGSTSTGSLTASVLNKLKGIVR